MFLTMLSARLPCCGDLLQIALQRRGQVVDLGAQVVGDGEFVRRHRVVQFVEQIDRQIGEIVDEVERVLDLVRDAGGELAERGHLLRLHQPVLGAAQIGERGLGGGARAARLPGTAARSRSRARHWPAKVCSSVAMVGAKPPAVRRRITSPPTTLSSRSSGTASTAWMPRSSPPARGSTGPAARRRHARARAATALRPRWVSPSLIRRSRSASTRSAVMPKADLGTNTSSAASNS